MNDLTTQDWTVLDEAHDNMETSMLDWCLEVSKMEDKQVEIAKRYGEDTSAISRMNDVGKHHDKYFLTNGQLIQNLPRGYKSLYEMIKLPKPEIKLLCKDRVPTRKEINERKYKLGIESRPVKKLIKPKGDVLVDWSIVPATELHGLSEHGVAALKKIEKKLVPVLAKVNKTVEKDVLTAFVLIATYNQTVINARVNAEVKKLLKQEKDSLDMREKRVMDREKAVSQGIELKDKKLIQGILHPDKAPAGQTERYAKAFNAFRKVS